MWSAPLLTLPFTLGAVPWAQTLPFKTTVLRQLASVYRVLTRVRSRQLLCFRLSDFSAPPVGVLVGVELEEQHRVDSQRDHTTNWDTDRHTHSSLSQMKWSIHCMQIRSRGKQSLSQQFWRGFISMCKLFLLSVYLGSWRAQWVQWMRERSAGSSG